MASTLSSYPATLPIVPLARPARGTVRVPGSKSITNRALVLAMLSERPCRLLYPLASEDTEVMIGSLRQLGARVEVQPDGLLVERPACPTFFPVTEASLFVANSGTTMRFLTALVCLGRGRYRLDGIPRMRQRPIEDLLQVLRQLGVEAHSEGGTGCPPVVVEAAGLPGGRARIRGDVSSQFLSGLLMAGTQAREDLSVEVEGELVSRPYVAMTVAMIRQMGGRVEEPGPQCFLVPGRQVLNSPPRSPIEPDASAASYFLAAAAITGGKVTVPGLGPASLQGDVRFAEVLRAMGCRVETGTCPETGEPTLTVEGGPLRGIDVDMNDISDTVMTLAAVACFADGPTTVRNVAHIRHKETDRLAALAIELRRIGAGVEEREDSLTVHPAALHRGEIDTYNDHRMAMSLALVGLRVPGIVIRDPGCVAKTYPGYFTDLDRLR